VDRLLVTAIVALVVASSESSGMGIGAPALTASTNFASS
jgi:hypothetical protein